MLWQSLPMPHKRPRKAAGERFGFWHSCRISNLNAPATFLERRKIRVIKYLMNIPQIFSKINPIVRDFRGLVSGKNQAAADRYYHQLHLKPWAKSPEEAAWALMQRIMGLVGEHKVPPLRAAARPSTPPR